MQELTALVQYIQKNKEDDMDWFKLKPKDKDGVCWSGWCWAVHELVKYEMPFEFELPAAYPTTAPEIKIPTLQGKTAKMYRVRATTSAVLSRLRQSQASPELCMHCRGVQSA